MGAAFLSYGRSKRYHVRIGCSCDSIAARVGDLVGFPLGLSSRRLSAVMGSSIPLAGLLNIPFKLGVWTRMETGVGHVCLYNREE